MKGNWSSKGCGRNWFAAGSALNGPLMSERSVKLKRVGSYAYPPLNRKCFFSTTINI